MIGYFYSPQANGSVAAGCESDWIWLSPAQKVAAMEEHLAHVAAAEGREYVPATAAFLAAAVVTVDNLCDRARLAYYPVVYRSPFYGFGGRYYGPGPGGPRPGPPPGPHPGPGPRPGPPGPGPGPRPAGQVADTQPPLAQAGGQAISNVVAATAGAVITQTLVLGAAVIALGAGAYLMLRKPSP